MGKLSGGGQKTMFERELAYKKIIVVSTPNFSERIRHAIVYQQIKTWVKMDILKIIYAKNR